MLPLETVAALKGNELLVDTTALEGEFQGYVAWQEAKIESMEVDGVALDSNDKIISTVVPFGMLFLFPSTQTITKIKLEYGQLNLIRK